MADGGYVDGYIFFQATDGASKQQAETDAALGRVMVVLRYPPSKLCLFAFLPSPTRPIDQ